MHACMQGHFGPWFMLFHQAFELEFENALMSVVPGLKALPYWQMQQDMKGECVAVRADHCTAILVYAARHDR